MKKILILVAVVLVAAGVAVYAFHGSGRDSNGRTVVSGNIELTEVNIGFKTAGRLIERTVDEGDLVKKGQLIARLDRDQLTAQRDSLAAGLASAQDNWRKRKPRSTGSGRRWRRTSNNGAATWPPAKPAWRR